MKYCIFFFLLFAWNISSAQNFEIFGRVVGLADKQPLPGVAVSLESLNDKRKIGTATDEKGYFKLPHDKSGRYLLVISYVGYQKIEKEIDLAKGKQDLGDLPLAKDNTTLQTITVTEKQTRGQQIGDTIQFNANAFKVNPDATAEDLLKKMPGITSDNNGLKSNGETIKKVLVDGKPFFGDDPNAALKNLPAEMVDKIQIFDNQSDQARFTGFRDMDADRAINITTKNGKNVGQFGKVYGGLGTDDHYLAGGNINYFNGARRISILALANNVNQQNFSISDIMNVMSNSGGLKGGIPAGPPPGMGSNNSKNNSPNSDTGPGALLVGQQSGITATRSAGLNYSDNWGKKINVSSSYFLNYTNNDNQTDFVRNYFTDSNLTYQETSAKKSTNQNHRANFRVEYAWDAQNMITLTPKLTIQKYKYRTTLNASNILSDDDLLGTTQSTDSANSVAYSFSNNLLYQHKFNKARRTISLNIATQFNDQNSSGTYYSLSNYSNQTTSITLDQRYNSTSKDHTLAGTLSYTEPLGANSQFMYSYTPSFTSGAVDKNTKSKNIFTNEYTDFDTSLSNRYDNTYVTHRNGFTYKYQKGRTNTSVGSDIQMATLKGDQGFPTMFSTSRKFNSVLPFATLEYGLGKNENLLINYRTATNAPSLSQLQNVLDISNPLQLSTGNPGLKQTYEHTMMARYGKTNVATSRNFFAFAMGNYTSAYISNALLSLSADTVINGYAVSKGSQLTLPVNLNGYVSGRMFGIYSLPVRYIKSNLNLNTGISYNRTPALLNNVLNYSNSLTWNGGFYLGSNISQNLDFSLSYNGNYNIVRNSVRTISNNSYYYHTANFKINWILSGRVVLNTDVTQTSYSGLGASYDQNFFLWNASVGYKFLKDRSLEAKFHVFDMLNQNRSVSRDITDSYTQDNTFKVLQRYGMLSMTYTIRNFKKGSKQPDAGFIPPPGMPPPPKD